MKHVGTSQEENFQTVTRESLEQLNAEAKGTQNRNYLKLVIDNTSKEALVRVMAAVVHETSPPCC